MLNEKQIVCQNMPDVRESLRYVQDKQNHNILTANGFFPFNCRTDSKAMMNKIFNKFKRICQDSFIIPRSAFGPDKKNFKTR